MKNKIAFRACCLFFLFSIVFLKAQEIDTLYVVAQKGDGIYSVLRNNGYNPNRFIKQFIALNHNVLGEDHHLVVGKTYILPFKKINPTKATTTAASKNLIVPPHDSVQIESIPVIVTPIIATATKTITVPLFGPKESSVPIVDNQLEGTIYYLVSGHGGPDPGAITYYDGHLLCEDEYAYDVTLRLARRLISHGATVYVIIQDKNDGIRNERLLKVDHDEINYPNQIIPLDQIERLKQRTQTVNELYSKNKGSYQRLAVIHVDSRNTNTNIDVFFYHHKKSNSGKLFAQNLQTTFNKNYARYQPNREYVGDVASRTSLYMVRKTWPTMAFIELGNLKNKKDQRRILNPENREALAKWISEGMILDFKTNKL
jgi:N-acetylmuramoyl-L-alanine amidase